MMKSAERERIELLRKEFPPGTKVILEEMDDAWAPPPGTEGEIVWVDDIGQLIVNWKNGSGLNLVPGVDRFRKKGG